MTATAHAVEYVGLPEARLNLAQAVLYLARAPKSNSVLTALDAATRDIRDGAPARVPPHLRDASYPGAARLGHGDGYQYPHADPTGWVDQAYRPPEAEGHRYYEPSGHGADVEVTPREAP